MKERSLELENEIERVAIIEDVITFCDAEFVGESEVKVFCDPRTETESESRLSGIVS